jgi:uncharacterized protein YndB with AHSA1/START domain
MTLDIEVAVDIHAPAERVWDILADVERWPEWTPSMRKVRRLDGGPLVIGSRARIKQPRLPASQLLVTECDPGRGFVWEAHSVGGSTVAGHWITPRPQGGVTVTLNIHLTGLLLPLFRGWLEKFIRRYMEMEAQGLKRRSESIS